MFSYTWRRKTFSRQRRGSLWFTLLRGIKSILLDVWTSFNFTFWASEFTFCVCVCVCVCVCLPLPSCFAFPQQCFCLHVCTYSVWTLWRRALRSAAGISKRRCGHTWEWLLGWGRVGWGGVVVLVVVVGWWVIWCGIWPRLLLSPEWFRGGTRAKEIHVILEREQEEEHRRAVISNVSTRSQPGAGLKQDSLVYIKELAVSLVSFTSCSSWTHTHSNVPRGARALENNGCGKMTCSSLNVLSQSGRGRISFLLCSLLSQTFLFAWHSKQSEDRSAVCFEATHFKCQGSVLTHLEKHSSWGSYPGKR